MFAGDTQSAFFIITDLTAAVTYTVWVELSYAFTIVKDKMAIQVVILLPQITLSTPSDTIIFAWLPTSGDTNAADITIFSQNVMLQVNIKGRWELPDGSSVTDSEIEFESFTRDLAGVYKFHVTSWSGPELVTIQIEISAIGNERYSDLSNFEDIIVSTLKSRLQLRCNDITRRIQNLIW